MANLLRQVASQGIHSKYVGKLLAASRAPDLESTGATLARFPAWPLIEPLSQRELEVLRLIADGLSNREIAEELIIAVTTAKKHVSNILGKLGVSNRTQAVARARELGLL